MQASGVYNRYMNIIYTSEEEEHVAPAPLQVPGAPVKAKKTVVVPADLHPHRIDFSMCPDAPKKTKKTVEMPADLRPVCIDFSSAIDCPAAPKKVKKTMKLPVDLHPRRIDFTIAFVCPDAPKKAKKTRILADRENVVPVQLPFEAPRTCPSAPKKLVKAVARTPLGWTRFTDADVAWFEPLN